MRNPATLSCRALIAMSFVLASAVGSAAELPRAAIASAKSAPSLELAVQYELKLQLPEGQGLARSLLDLGVDSSDAALVARLAAGHLGADAGGCDVKISISRAAQKGEFRLMRVRLLTRVGETVIERRGGELTIASQGAAHGFRRLV